MTETRPAFYALAPGGWRDYVTLLHPPYTLWHLGYVAIGAALAPRVEWLRLAETLVAFFLALGIGAHALDELRGRPLRTQIPSRTLVALAVMSIAGAAAIGIVVALQTNVWILAFVAAGVFLVVAYNLELAGGRFHGDWWFAVAWGAFPLATAYFAQRGRIDGTAVAASAFAALLSYAQRLLSTHARSVRRETHRADPQAAEALTRPAELTLRALAAAVVALAVALLLRHVR